MMRTLLLLLALAPWGCASNNESSVGPAADGGATAAAARGPVVPDAHGQLTSLAPLVESVKSAVINVEVVGQRRGPQMSPQNPFEDFFGMPGPGPQMQPPVQRGIGSGFIIDARGLALTNNHVVEGATSIRVKLEDGRRFDAEVLGRDPLTDLALLQLKGDVKDLPRVMLGDSDALQVGDWVVAIGNPFGLASSVSAGIVSAKARNIGAGPYDEFLQTDAAINPGNSGGPLFNLRGEVVGINTAIAGGGAGGIGFAVPSNLAKALWPRLEKEGSIRRGYLGVAIQDLTPALATALGVPVKEGALVGDVTPGTPAAEAGLKSEDVVIAIDGEKVESASDLSRTVALKAPGTEVTLGILRGGKEQNVKVKLGTRPDFEGVAQSLPGRAQQAQTEKLGLTIRDMDPRIAAGQKLPSEGALIVNVTPASPAERGGLGPGMVITEVRGKGEVKDAQSLRKLLEAAQPGETLLLRVAVQGGTVLRTITVPERSG